MKVLYLSKYSSFTRAKIRYLFDPVNGSVKKQTFKNHDERSKNCSGVAAYKIVWMTWKFKKAFIALYVEGNKLLLRINSQVFDCRDKELKVKVTGIFPFTRRFKVCHRNKRVLSFVYFCTDFPGTGYDDYDTNDLMLCIEAMTKDVYKKNMDKFVYIWTEFSKGNTPDYSKEDFG